MIEKRTIDHGDWVETIFTLEGGLRVTSVGSEAQSPPGRRFAKPGDARAAFKSGDEDHYIDAMRNRFGGEW